MEICAAAVRSAIEQSIGKRDEDLAAYLQHQLVVPKLCLMTAVMEQLEITTLTYQSACGSCAGLLVHDHFWGNRELYWPSSDVPRV